MAKRKYEDSTRKFNDEWTEQFVFVATNDMPTCLICQTKVAVSKKSNLQRHYLTHSTFDKKYPLKSAARSERIDRLKASLKQQVIYYMITAFH